MEYPQVHEPASRSLPMVPGPILGYAASFVHRIIAQMGSKRFLSNLLPLWFSVPPSARGAAGLPTQRSGSRAMEHTDYPHRPAFFHRIAKPEIKNESADQYRQQKQNEQPRQDSNPGHLRPRSARGYSQQLILVSSSCCADGAGQDPRCFRCLFVSRAGFGLFVLISMALACRKLAGRILSAMIEG